MSLIDNLRGTTAALKYPGAPQAPIIAEQLEQARATLTDLEARHDQASLDAYSDAPGAKAALAKLNADLAAARDDVGLLQSAHRGAVERDRVELLRQRQDQLETAQRSMTANLASRDKATKAFVAAVAEADKQFRLIVRHTEQAHHVWGVTGLPLPQGAIDATQIIRLAGDEAWRHTSGALTGDPFKLPGAVYSHADYIGNPNAVPELEGVMAKDRDWLKVQTAKMVPK